MNTHFTVASGRNTYLLVKESQKYDGYIPEKIAKYAKCIGVQMSLILFNRPEPISILSFLQKFQTAWDSSEIHEGVATWLFQYLTKDSVEAALAHCVSSTENDDPQNEEKLATCCRAVNYLLPTFTSYDVIAKAKAKVTNFKQPKYMSTVRYLVVLWETSLRFGLFYKEIRLKVVFMEGLYE